MGKTFIKDRNPRAPDKVTKTHKLTGANKMKDCADGWRVLRPEGERKKRVYKRENATGSPGKSGVFREVFWCPTTLSWLGSIVYGDR